MPNEVKIPLGKGYELVVSSINNPVQREISIDIEKDGEFIQSVGYLFQDWEIDNNKVFHFTDDILVRVNDNTEEYEENEDHFRVEDY